MTENPTDPLLCGCCDHQLVEDEPATCRACVGKVRADLHAITNSYALLPTLMAEGALGSNAPRRNQSRSDEAPLPGGVFLVMLSGGGDGRQALRRLWAAEKKTAITGKPHDEPQPGEDDSPDDPASVAWVLGSWEDDFRDVHGLPAAQHAYLVSPALAFLHLYLQWAANKHPRFVEFAGEMRQLVWALAAATGTSESPMKAEPPCIDCGGPLIRKYRQVTHQGTKDQTGGLEPDWTCRGCKREYTPSGYMLACRDHIEKAVDLEDRWVPATYAADHTRTKYRTVQSWSRRGLLTHRTNASGVLEVRLKETMDLVETRAAAEAAG